MTKPNSLKRTRLNELQVTEDAHPGWVRGSERALRVGDPVQCAAGAGEVAAVLGKTGDGSRLLQIRLPDGAAPFFAAASNVLVAPV